MEWSWWCRRAPKWLGLGRCPPTWSWRGRWPQGESDSTGTESTEMLVTAFMAETGQASLAVTGQDLHSLAQTDKGFQHDLLLHYWRVRGLINSLFDCYKSIRVFKSGFHHLKRSWSGRRHLGKNWSGLWSELWSMPSEPMELCST